MIELQEWAEIRRLHFAEKMGMSTTRMSATRMSAMPSSIYNATLSIARQQQGKISAKCGKPGPICARARPR